MYIGRVRRKTAAAFVRQWLRKQHETAEENKPLETRSSLQTEPESRCWPAKAMLAKFPGKRSFLARVYLFLLDVGRMSTYTHHLYGALTEEGHAADDGVHGGL